MTGKPSILAPTLDQLTETLQTWDEPSYRARQIWAQVYQRLIHDPHLMTDLPIPLREKLAEAYNWQALDVSRQIQSQDGETTKFLLSLDDGAAIETVLMRYDRRRTACISTQVGCAMGCVFCATGQMGYRRNLTQAEISGQVLFVARQLQAHNQKLTNVVFMGMGEPFHNYDATLAAIDRLNDPEGFDFGARRFTISTVGLIPEINRLASEGRQVNLAVSLHAATDELRNSMLPINKKYPLGPLMQACATFVHRTGRRITFEWALVEGVNDTVEQAQALAQRIAGLNSHVNLIPLNPTRAYAGQASSHDNVERFRQLLEGHGLSVTVRLRRGIDIQAGCGQLATQSK
ncbi:MAG: 23S rRNA (adenine(2503)-C(2))-methyltransferase RlmN [Anaerolineales bacterium]